MKLTFILFFRPPVFTNIEHEDTISKGQYNCHGNHSYSIYDSSTVVCVPIFADIPLTKVLI